MSQMMELFIDGPARLGEVSAELGHELGIKFGLVGNPPGYSAVLDGVAMELGRHRYVDDKGIPFERYPFVLEAKGTGDHHEEVLRKIFDVFKTRWSLLLTRDLQVELDRSEPSAADGVAL